MNDAQEDGRESERVRSGDDDCRVESWFYFSKG